MKDKYQIIENYINYIRTVKGYSEHTARGYRTDLLSIEKFLANKNKTIINVKGLNLFIIGLLFLKIVSQFFWSLTKHKYSFLFDN